MEQKATVALGTVVGWASQRDTGSARMRWKGTSGSVLLGVARGQAESRPPRHRVAPGDRDGVDEAWRLYPGPTCYTWQSLPRFQGDESGPVPYYVPYYWESFHHLVRIIRLRMEFRLGVSLRAMASLRPRRANWQRALEGRFCLPVWRSRFTSRITMSRMRR